LNADAAPPPRRPRRRWLRIIGLLCLLTTVALLAILGGGYYLSTRTPAGFAQATETVAALPAPQQQQTAQSLEKRTTRAVTDRRQPEPWTYRLDWADANAWLAQRLRPWAASQDMPIPQQIGRVAVWSADGRITLGVEVNAEPLKQVLSLGVETRIDEHGQLIVRVADIRAGRLPLPADAVLDRLGLDQHPQFAEFAPLINQATQGIPLQPAQPIDPTRQVRITDINVDNEGVTLTLVTERQPNP
jgi:hypothetical protein